ncbi:hypothetical protein IT571_03030 [Candidatus Sumerlaeota bacterium]|nr:hypothetical protein [Candidatus Sumerlaeota bacterium]
MEAKAGEPANSLKKFLTSRVGSLVFFALWALVIFHRALGNEYAFDDPQVMRRLSTPGPVPLSVLWQPANFGNATGFMSWRPLAVGIHILVDRELFAGNPALSHALNILLHATTGWVLYILAGALGLRRGAALFAGLFFIAHPLASEVVLCAEFRFDTLALLFAMVAMLLTMKGVEGALRPWYLAAAAGALLLGLGAKENATVAVPLAALLVFLRTRSVGKTALACAPLVLATLAFVAVWVLFRAPNYGAGFLGGGGRALGMTNFLVSFEEIYFRKCLMPWPLRVDHDFQPVLSFVDGRVIRALAVVGLLVGAGVLGSLWRRNILVGCAWIAVGFSTVSQVTPVPDPVAERFCYIPLAGAALIAGDVMALLLQRGARFRAAIFSVAGMLLMIFAGITWRRSFDWRDDVTLNIANWEQVNARGEKARLSLGALDLTRAADAHAAGDHGAARQWEAKSENNRVPLMESARPEPPAEALRMMGVLRLMRGDRDGARAFAARALRLEPENPQVQKLAAATGLLGDKK